MPEDHSTDRPIDTSVPPSDEVKYTTCYMCACRCGIRVHLKDGSIRYIEGNPNHPVNRGVLCAKGSAGIMQHYAPARLTKPLIRVGPRGSGEFREIEWEEAMQTATSWLSAIRNEDPKKLAFFTGRDQSQALTGWWAAQFGTPNHAAHGGFCSVNMAAGGLYTIGGSFWEFGEPDWERTRFFMMFGVAEDHDSNPIKIGLGKIKARGAKFVSVNPVRSGYSAIADEWLGVTPGTDGLFILSLVHQLLKMGKIDLDYLIRYSNLTWLVVQDPSAENHGLFARNAEGDPLCLDRQDGEIKPYKDKGLKATLKGEAVLDNGQKAIPAFMLLAERYLDERYSPEEVAPKIGVKAETLRRLAREIATAAFEEEVVIEQPWTDWKGERHERMIGRPVSFHAMRGISAHSNGFHTCRALHLLQVLLGSIDTPGGFRYKPPFPRPIPPGPKPSGKPEQVKAGSALPGPPLGFPTGPEDLLLQEDGSPQRLDKAFSWDYPMAIHGMMHMVITNAWKGDPYPIDTLFLYMANMAWNSAMNTAETIKMLTDQDEDSGEYKIPKIIYSDAYYSETVAYADLILPDTTYLERWDCISTLDRPICEADGPADAIRQPVVKPDRDVRPFQDVLLDLGYRLGLPAMTKEDGTARYPGGYSDYIVNHERKPGVGSLMGWRGEKGEKTGKGEPNPDQLKRYIENECFWHEAIAPEALFYKHANQSYLDYAAERGFIEKPDPVIFQLYSEVLQRFRLAAEGHGALQPPDSQRERIKAYFDPLPFWYPPFEDSYNVEEDYPLHAVTQRPMAMYHSWGSMNAWLRQIHGSNRLYVPSGLAEELDLKEGDWARVTSRNGEIVAPVRVMDGVNEKTLWTWNAIGKRSGTWGLSKDANESKEGFLLNHLIDELLPEQESGYRYSSADPVTGQAAWYDLRVRIEKAEEPRDARDLPQSQPAFPSLPPQSGQKRRPDFLRFGARFWSKTNDGLDGKGDA